jgi:hypothetical protein
LSLILIIKWKWNIWSLLVVVVVETVQVLLFVEPVGVPVAIAAMYCPNLRVEAQVQKPL